jgi:hypothetical protein
MRGGKMAIPTSYLTTTRNLAKILASIQNAQAPKQFSTRFLASLGFPSAADRLIIGVLKSLGFLTAEGVPTRRYFEYLDQTQSKRVMADGVREAYADLFQINRKAHELSGTEIKNKLKTLTQGQLSESVLDKMVLTLKALAGHADFAASVTTEKETPEPSPVEVPSDIPLKHGINLGGLVYNIQLVLPSDRDQAVYDALFRSLKEHLLK